MTNLQAISTQQSITIEKAKIDASRANKAAQDFEAVYISEMLKPMIETVEVDENFGGGKGEEVFRGMLVQELGKSIAKQGGLGLAEHVRAELMRIQETQSNKKIN